MKKAVNKGLKSIAVKNLKKNKKNFKKVLTKTNEMDIIVFVGCGCSSMVERQPSKLNT